MTFMDDIRKAKSTNDTQDTSIETLSTSVDANEADIDTLEASVSVAEISITALQHAVSTPFKLPVDVVATANADITTAYAADQTLDDVTLATGMRILLTGQTDAKQNGIYDVTADIPTRAVDFDDGAQCGGALVIVLTGTAGAMKLYQCTDAGPTIDTDDITFVERSWSA